VEAGLTPPNAGAVGWRDLWRAPDLSLRQAGADAERMLAQRRVWVIAMLLPIVGAMWAQYSFDTTVRAMLAIATLALGESMVVRRLVERGVGPDWIGFASSVGDVVLVTACLVALALSGRPDLALRSTTVFPLYYLVIVSTALRYDARITVVATSASLLCYGGFLLHMARVTDVVATQGAEAPALDWSFQFGKLVMIGAFGMVAVSLIERSRRMSLLSTRDALTGLLNRRFLGERLVEETERARRGEGSCALALVDVDYFKRTNDTHGHTVGDTVLREIGEALSGSFRATDVVARFGGDEFALLLPQARPEELFERFEAARLRVAALSQPGEGARPPRPVSLSIGYAVAPADGATPEGILEVADRRLYAAKAAGRNCVLGPELAAREHGGRATSLPH